MLRAVLWDVDGTLAETELDGHRVAFNRAFAVHGVRRRWSRATYLRLLQVAGGLERLRHDFAARGIADDALAARLHRTKNDVYATLVASGRVALRPGVRRLVDACADAGLVQAIATTTSRANVEALLASAFGRDATRRFAVLACAEDAPSKKPDPAVYRVALERLGVAASAALAIEDSPAGVQAARAAGLAVLVTRGACFAHAAFDDATAVCDGLDGRVAWRGGAAARVDVDVLRRIAASVAEAGVSPPADVPAPRPDR